jgi:hypothetical protein
MSREEMKEFILKIVSVESREEGKNLLPFYYSFSIALFLHFLITFLAIPIFKYLN